MSSNIQRLGAALSDRMKRTAGAAVPTCLELGAITANLSLVTDGLRVSIPRGEYLVNITLASETYRTSADTHSHSGGEHTTAAVPTPSIPVLANTPMTGARTSTPAENIPIDCLRTLRP